MLFFSPWSILEHVFLLIPDFTAISSFSLAMFQSSDFSHKYAMTASHSFDLTLAPTSCCLFLWSKFVDILNMWKTFQWTHLGISFNLITFSDIPFKFQSTGWRVYYCWVCLPWNIIINLFTFLNYSKFLCLLYFRCIKLPMEPIILNLLRIVFNSDGLVFQ